MFSFSPPALGAVIFASRADIWSPFTGIPSHVSNQWTGRPLKNVIQVTPSRITREFFDFEVMVRTGLIKRLVLSTGGYCRWEFGVGSVHIWGTRAEGV